MFFENHLGLFLENILNLILSLKYLFNVLCKHVLA